MGKVYPWLEVVTPVKRPRKRDYTEEARDFNRQVSKVRIVASTALCRVCQYRICKDFYRGRDEKHGLYWGVVVGW